MKRKELFLLYHLLCTNKSDKELSRKYRLPVEDISRYRKLAEAAQAQSIARLAAQ